MARPPFLHQKKLDAFKHEIRYERLLSKLPPDKRVLVDWGQLLKEFKDAEGVTWRGKDPSVFAIGSMANLNVNLKSDLGIVGMNVYSLTDGQKEAIEVALHTVSMTSMEQVDHRLYEACFADFCLEPRDPLFENIMSRFDFVYGNLYVELHYIEYAGKSYERNVLPIARALHAAMQKAVAANPEGKLPARPRVSYTVNPTRVKVGENFTVTAKFDGGAQLDPKTFRVAKDLVSNNIEYQENLGTGVYKFTATLPGMGTVAFSLLDKKTLWVFSDTVTVHIDPAQSK